MSHLADSVYRRLPPALQNLGLGLWGLRYRHERLGGRFPQYVAEFAERDRCSEAEMQAHLRQRLHELLPFAFDRVPYYRKRWTDAGLCRADVERITPDQLAALPVTPKDDVRRDPYALAAANPHGRLLRYSTSGSTGTPVTALCTSDSHRRFMAGYEVRSFGWAGASIRGPRAMMGGRIVVPKSDSHGPFYRYNFAEQQVYFSAYHINPANAANYVEGIRRYRPPLFTGYAHSYYFLSRMILAQRLKIGYEPRCLVLTSEKITPEMKDVIQRAFHARVYEEYGSVENCLLVTECGSGRLHVSPDFGIVELVDEGGFPVPPGTPGRVLATSLLNDVQPLIRYEIGDVATWSGEACPCGRRQLPVLAAVEGRLEDALVGPDGRATTRFNGVFVNVPGVVEAQLIQEQVDLIHVRVVATPEFSAPQRKLIEMRLQERLGAVRVTFETVERIERTNRGKFRAVISHLPRGTRAGAQSV